MANHGGFTVYLICPLQQPVEPPGLEAGEAEGGGGAGLGRGLECHPPALALHAGQLRTEVKQIFTIDHSLVLCFMSYF